MLQITYRRRSVDIIEAVQNCTDPKHISGELENMKAKAELQDSIIARMLMVQFGQYEDHFNTPEDEPKTDADKLAFILADHSVVEV